MLFFTAVSHPRAFVKVRVSVCSPQACVYLVSLVTVYSVCLEEAVIHSSGIVDMIIPSGYTLITRGLLFVSVQIVTLDLMCCMLYIRLKKTINCHTNWYYERDL